MLDNSLIRLAYLLPHLVKYLAFFAKILFYLFICFWKLNRHQTFRVSEKFDVIDQNLIAVLFVLAVTLIFGLFEKAESVYIFIEKVMFANSIDKLTALVDYVNSNWLLVDLAQLFFSHIKSWNEGVRVQLRECMFEEDEVRNCPLNWVFCKTSFYFDP